MKDVTLILDVINGKIIYLGYRIKWLPGSNMRIIVKTLGMLIVIFFKTICSLCQELRSGWHMGGSTFSIYLVCFRLHRSSKISKGTVFEHLTYVKTVPSGGSYNIFTTGVYSDVILTPEAAGLLCVRGDTGLASSIRNLEHEVKAKQKESKGARLIC